MDHRRRIGEGKEKMFKEKKIFQNKGRGCCNRIQIEGRGGGYIQ